MADKAIFVVDDDLQMRKAISAALKRSGYNVTAFEGAREALKALRIGPCALLMTDVRMAAMTGLELLQEVKRLKPDLPVIVMTAYGTIQDAVDAMKLGALDYLLKPFSLEEVEETVHQILQEGEPDPKGVDQEDHRLKSPGAKVFVTADAQMKKVLRFVRDIAPSRATVLIQGESGTGKELVARMIHDASSVRAGSFVAVNCAAIPDGLLESELFGHEKGAFSGAHGRRVGKFERAHGGTLLLDEIGEMPLPLQVKLLRVLQEKEIDRVGGSDPVPVNVRILATTNRDLREEVQAGRFREDLYYRLNVVPIQIPPLKERPLDLIPISEYYLQRCASREGKPITGLSDEAKTYIQGQRFPGNVRELKNLIERAVLLCPGPLLKREHLTAHAAGIADPAEGAGAAAGQGSVKTMEQELILETLKQVKGNRTQASHLLGISLRTLRNKLADYKKKGIAVPPYEPREKGGKKTSLHCTGP
ncbi:MAG: sigma-54 dependent transcriptional regulator [bacterium]|nr:sigma-54 dependent transcriptional regulator [bacterium]